jgi:hypothetical protein
MGGQLTVPRLQVTKITVIWHLDEALDLAH